MAHPRLQLRRAAVVTPLVLLLVGPAQAQITSDDIRCIDTINKGLQKVALTENKALRLCAQDLVRGVLAAPNVTTCAAPEVHPKVQKQAIKRIQKADQKCEGAPPPIGPTSTSAFALRAIQTSRDILGDIFGSPLDDALALTDVEHKCQKEIFKAVQKCEHTRLGEFNRCKKAGLKSGLITDETTLSDQCLGTGALQPDAKGKINKQCVLKPLLKIGSKCVNKGVALDTAFPGCGTTDANALTLCFDRSIRCRTCELLNTADGLARDCDLMDDADDGNSSCSEPTTCGDGQVDGAEACDDGGTAPGDGCSATCTIETGYQCSGAPSACSEICGDGLVTGAEGCDDGGTAPGDGCSATCTVESGYQCSGAPSSCSEICGDGLVTGAEACDDGGTTPGDGCSATCTVETGYQCSGAPSACAEICGDGLVIGAEGCDDGGTSGGDGCSAGCQVETGYQCSGEPSSCATICGDGLIIGGETCDDGGSVAGDGCSATCQIETGWTCSGEPSACSEICGDSLVTGSEACDDGGTTPGDGCNASCQIEAGFSCAGAPSVCTAGCGDGAIVGSEGCDDGNPTSGDGCSAVCQPESGYQCLGAPSICVTVCGDGLVAGAETCDDGGFAPGDGCSGTCQIETGYGCTGQPSDCDPICGDGQILGGEDCDDGGTTFGDGCNTVCELEAGFFCTGEPSVCTPFSVVITSPTHGSFSQLSSLNVEGFTDLPPAQGTLRINGSLVALTPGGTFSTPLTLDPNEVFNPIRATVTHTLSGSSAHDRVVVIAGDSVADGTPSLESVALRLNDSGLDQVEPLVADLAGEGLDLATLVPVGLVLVNNECFIDLLGACLGRATVVVAPPPPSISGFGLEMNSQTNFVAGDITVDDIIVNVDLQGSGLVPSCDITITADHAFFDGNYALEPDPVIPTQLDVNQLGALDVDFTGFDTSFGGICDAPIIGDIIQAFLPDVEALTIDAMADFLDDPDGGGPADSPTAEAIETALAGIEISGPIGSALEVMLDTPIFQAVEDVNGLTIGTDSTFTSEVGTGPGQCTPPIGAPDLTESLAIAASFPPFGPNTPVGGVPYDLGLCISAEGFNQLLKAQTECGLLSTSIDTLDSLPLNAGFLTFLMPQFSIFPPATPFRIDIQPTLAPIVTSNTGPGGELGELRIAQVLVAVVQDDGSEVTALAGAFDANIGFDLEFAPGGLGFVLTAPPAEDITVAILINPLGVDETTLENDVLPPLIALLLPDLAGGLGSFPLPEFFGLNLDGVEVSRNGDFLSLFADLNP